MDNQAKKLGTERHGDQCYEVYGYLLPTKLDATVTFLKKYFKVLDKFSCVPYDYKRRKVYKEFAETAIMILARVEQFLSIKRPLIAGSRYINPAAWAIFGEAEDLFPKHSFKDFESICNFYEKRIFKNPNSDNTKKEMFHFRHEPNLCNQLAAKYDETPHYIMTVALAFLRDIILNCGPDCQEFYDIFTNDYREDAEAIDIDQWQELRCKVLGRNGKITTKTYNVKVGQVNLPSIPLVTVTTIEEISDDDNLAQGEKTSLAKTPRVFSRVSGCIKTGDKVEICKVKPINDIRWLFTMDETLGKIGEVKTISYLEGEYQVEFSHHNNTGINSCLTASFWYAEEWVTLVIRPPLDYEPGDETNEMYESAPEVQRKMQKYRDILPVSRCGFGPPNMI
jgi:hypothetical protein